MSSNEYFRLYSQKRRDEWLLANGPCAKCGSWQTLEVDHIDPSSKDPRLRGSSGNYWRWNKKERLKELAKCQVLCRPCHREKTTQERKKTHCPGGHEYTSRNTYVNAKGSFMCRICLRNRSEVNNAKIRARKIAAKNLVIVEQLVVFS